MASHALKSPSDVIDLLTDQHEQIKSLFTETLVLAGDERARSFRICARSSRCTKPPRRRSCTRGRSRSARWREGRRCQAGRGARGEKATRRTGVARRRQQGVHRQAGRNSATP